MPHPVEVLIVAALLFPVPFRRDHDLCVGGTCKGDYRVGVVCPVCKQVIGIESLYQR